MEQEPLSWQGIFAKIHCLTCSISHSFIRVDALVQFLAIEEILQNPLDLGDTSGSAHKDNLMDLGFVEGSIPKGLLHWFQGASEEVTTEFLKSGTGDGGVEVNPLKE